MSFSLHQGGVVISSQITHTQSSNVHPLAHIVDTCNLIFSSCALFTVYHNLIMKWHPTPLQVITTRAREGGPKEHREMQKMASWNSFSYICTRALHSFVFFVHWRAVSSVIPLLPKATFTHLSSLTSVYLVPATPLTTAINTLVAIRYSSILSTCQTISTLSDPLYSQTPFLFQLSHAPLHS